MHIYINLSFAADCISLKIKYLPMILIALEIF